LLLFSFLCEIVDAMAMSRMMIALSCLAALTFVSNASPFSKGIIYTILCTIGRIDWSDITTAKTASNAVVEIDAGADAADSPAAPLEVDTQPVENVRMDNGDGEDIIDPTIGCSPVLDTTTQDTKQRSRASSISSTTSLFDKPTHNERPSTPDTEIGDIPEFSTLASKYQDGPVVVNTECLTEPSTATSTPDVQPSSNTSVTQYSMKPTELVHAVDDFSLPIPTPPTSTSNKRNLDDTLQHESESKIASEGRAATDDTLLMPESATKTIEQPPQSISAVPRPKKRKLNSRQRRQRTLRLVGGSAPPTPSPLSERVQ
jgi:hypothetical protein